MLQPLFNRIHEKHRFLAILITSSVIGVVLLLVAVYNAAKDLERLHDVDNLYRFANAQLHSGQTDTGDFQHLLLLGELGYRVMIVRGDGLLAVNAAASGAVPAYTPAALEATRVNERGGYIGHDGRSVTWTRVPLPDNSAQLFVLHDFASSDEDSLVRVYAGRLLIPAALYIWLMTWMGCTLSFLTDKLSRQNHVSIYNLFAPESAAKYS